MQTAPPPAPAAASPSPSISPLKSNEENIDGQALWLALELEGYEDYNAAVTKDSPYTVSVSRQKTKPKPPDANAAANANGANNTSVVYFILGEKTGLVKIGYSTDLDDRIKSIRDCSGQPVRLLATTDGHRVEEGFFHRILKEYRGIGEWFENRGNVLNMPECITKKTVQSLNTDLIDNSDLLRLWMMVNGCTSKMLASMRMPTWYDCVSGNISQEDAGRIELATGVPASRWKMNPEPRKKPETGRQTLAKYLAYRSETVNGFARRADIDYQVLRRFLFARDGDRYMTNAFAIKIHDATDGAVATAMCWPRPAPETIAANHDDPGDADQKQG